ncbi:MAG: SDR family oxidoreductase [Rhodospirillaceae bacterium]|nr:SDR family oxidoreductase [Rhodospirillaceae bacterium]
MHVLIFGATRNTGFETAKILRARGDTVTAVVRATSETSALKELGVSLVSADAFNGSDLQMALKGLSADAALCSLGNTRGTPERVDHVAVANVVDACAGLGIKRFILISSIGAGNSRPALSPQAEKFLGPVCALKTLGENHLFAAGLDYTVIRPGGLGHGPASGRGVLSEDPLISGSIRRAEVARLAVQCLDDPKTIGHVYSAIEL